MEGEPNLTPAQRRRQLKKYRRLAKEQARDRELLRRARESVADPDREIEEVRSWVTMWTHFATMDDVSTACRHVSVSGYSSTEFNADPG